MKVEGVKVFSATKARDRAVLGDEVTKWIAENPGIDIIERVVTQSSDDDYHCLSITIFYTREEPDED